ncbi:MAG: hypothetical protein ACR2FU_01295 [Streptosporangiaceae bacterium]
MDLTWRDAVSTLAIVVITIAYAAYLAGTSLLLISSAWATTAVILVLGFGCAVNATGDLYARPHSAEVLRRITTVISMIALIAGLIGLISSGAYALKILVMATITLLGTATTWHVFTVRSEQ